MSYLGNTPELQNYAAGSDRFSGDASTTTFVLARRVTNANDVIAIIESVYQDPFTAYTITANTTSGTADITFTSAPPTGANNIVVNYRATQIVSYNIVTSAQLQANSVTTAKIADGAITADKIADGTIVAADIAANTVTPAKLAYNTAGTFLTTDGASVLWRAQSALAIANTQITGLITASQGGTGITSLGTGVATWLGTPTAANLATVVTDETGSGNLVFSTAPSLSTPVITNYTETQFASNTGTAITISLANGTLQNLTCNASTTITLPASAAGKSFILIINYAGAFTVAWAGGTTIKWPGGTTPTATSTSGKYDIFSFFQDGVNTYGQTFGLNY
jgi:hypothetical protein